MISTHGETLTVIHCTDYSLQKSHHLSCGIVENDISIHEIQILRMLKRLPETEAINDKG